MKHLVGIARMVVAGMILTGGAVGMFGNMQLAATNHAYPRVPRTEQEEAARVQKDGEAPAMMKGLSLVARGRSGQTDPDIPIAPVTFSTRGSVSC